jgi:biotin-[acetyl-CoA-carboxylase] ligase BirA-like protein
MKINFNFEDLNFEDLDPKKLIASIGLINFTSDLDPKTMVSPEKLACKTDESSDELFCWDPVNLDNLEALYRLSELDPIYLAVIDKTDSTNEYLKRLSHQLPDGFVVIAREQLSGKGRRSRSWISQKDQALLMSTIMKSINLEALNWLNAAMSLAVCEVVEDCFSIELSIKWPNDVIFELNQFTQPNLATQNKYNENKYKKICGILSESSISSNGTVDYVIVGVGLNLLKLIIENGNIDACDITTGQAEAVDKSKSEVSGLKPYLSFRDGEFDEDCIFLEPISLDEILEEKSKQQTDGPKSYSLMSDAVELKNTEYDKEKLENSFNCFDSALNTLYVPLLANEIVKKFRSNLELIENGGLYQFFNNFKRKCVTLNKKVKVYLDDGEILYGIASDITNQGELLVETEVCIKTVAAGDVVHLREERQL